MSQPVVPITMPPASSGQRDRLLGAVEDRIQRVLAEERARWAEVDPRGPVPVEMVSTLINAGGKRLRPTFCVTGFLAAGGDPGDRDIVHAAAGLEFLHAFALIHDDIMDDAPLRRGLPTAHTRLAGEHAARGWRGESRRYGESVAILAGDLAHAYAYRLMSSAPPEAQAVWDTLTGEMIIGQFLDVTFGAESVLDPDLSRWIAVGKSGRYSIHRPLELGATIAGRPELAGAFEEYGTAVGEAFQLRDDLIDAYGDYRAAGKQTGQDLAHQKMTLLLALAAQHDGRIRELVTGACWPEETLRALMDSAGVRDVAEQRIDELVADARTAIARTVIPAHWQEELATMAVRVAYRDR